MTVAPHSLSPKKKIRFRVRVPSPSAKLPKADALREIMALIDLRAPTDANGNPINLLSPLEYDTLLNDIYVLAADALGVPLE